jgi:hypothetical protein
VAVSPLELTSAYTAFASLGTAVEPRWILAVEDADGRVLWRSKPRRRQVLDPGVAYLITDVLSEALESGTGYRVRQSGVRAPAAGKTGTTNDGADAWFVGYTPEIAAGIWVGFDQPRPIVEDATGGKLAAPLWASIVRRTQAGRPLPKAWSKPEGVVERPVDPSTGLVLKEGCFPTKGQAYRELFLKDAVPAAWCPGREPMPRQGFPVQSRAREETLRAAELQAERERVAQAERARQEKEQEEQDKEEKRLAQLREEKQQEKERIERQEETERQARAREERELREERQARIRAQEEQEHRLAEREAELRKAEERLRRQRDERARERDPESEVADVEVQEAERDPREDEEEEEASSDLSGWWELTNRIQTSKVGDYVGLRLGYQLKLEQDGNRISGRGQKWTEDGRRLSGSARSPIRVSGTIDGDTLTLEFTEQGARRSSGGGFTLHLSADRTALRGSFWSDVAGTTGSTLARRMP